jgi:hypothetical protein
MTPVRASAAMAFIVKSRRARSSSRLSPKRTSGCRLPLGVQVAPVRRDFYLEAADRCPYRPEALPDVPEVLRVRPEQALDLPGPRPRRGIGVQPCHPEQPVAQVPADQVQLLPRIPERLTEAPDRPGISRFLTSAIIVIGF